MPRVPNISSAEAARRRAKLAPAASEPAKDANKAAAAKKPEKKKSPRKA